MSVVYMWTIAVLAANLINSIGPQRFAPNEDLAKALFVGQQMDSRDLLVSYRFDWTVYVTYFTHKETLYLYSQALRFGRETAMAQLVSIIEEQQRQGPRTFVEDLDGLTQPDWDYISATFGLVRDDYLHLEKREVAKWRDETIWEVVGVR
jgi:hypothetical protein